jgi:hypothetical protein
MYKGRIELQKKRLSAKKNLTLNTGGHNVQTFRNDHIYNTFNVCYAFHQWNFLLNALWYTGSSIHIDPVEKKDD